MRWGPNLLVKPVAAFMNPTNDIHQTDKLPNCKIEVSKHHKKHPRTFEMPRNFFPFLTRKVGYPRFFSVGFLSTVRQPGPKAEARKML